MNYYQRSVTEIIHRLDTDTKNGLTLDQVAQRVALYGYNELPADDKESWIIIFLRQFTSPLIYILLAAAALIFFVGEHKTDAFVISGVLLFNAIVGAIQEGRTRTILSTLKRYISTSTIVIRAGVKMVIADAELVPGDIILLQSGERVPADARIIKSNALQVDEAVLTGESAAILKNDGTIERHVRIENQTNMVFKGTYIVSGTGVAIVTATGQNTEIGKIHAAIQEIKTEIPLKKDIEKLSYTILIFIFCVCITLFGVGILMGKPIDQLAVMLTALFICVVPEGLPVVLTLVLVSGAYRMARKFVLVKNLQAVETLGRTDVIIIDKTGTLTRNELIVSKVCTQGKEFTVTGQGYFPQGQVLDGNVPVVFEQDSVLEKIAIATSLLNSAEITYTEKQKVFDIKGDPTEAALYVLGGKLGVDRGKLENSYKKIYEIPFDSLLRYHAGFYEHKEKGEIFIIGSPEILRSRSVSVPTDYEQQLARLLDEGYRVVEIGYKVVNLDQFPSSKDSKDLLSSYKKLVEDGITLVGLCGIQDSIRSEVPAVVRQARNAGIKVIMATGDHQKTALFVAKKVGLFEEGDLAIDGKEFASMDSEQINRVLPYATVFSRVSPTEKMRLINLFREKNKVVAMTGDGINDAPSLVAADLGIAMGGVGTEVAKAASDLILLNDSFANIMSAVAEGRHILYTLRRVILYFFATNMGEIFIVLFAMFTFLPLPISAVQILWLNLVTDGFLDIALAAEPQESGLLSPRWLSRKIVLVDRNLLLRMLFIAIPMGLTSIIMFWWYYSIKQTGLAHARTITLITMAMFQWFNAWNCRSEHKSLFSLGFFSNRWLIAATLFVLFLQVLVLYTQPLQSIFKTVPLSVQDWFVVIAVSVPIMALEEIRKAVAAWWWKE